ncbi:MAG: carboxypeptidase-like regulatory domain-containing protein [Bacteroidota bacterium]
MMHRILISAAFGLLLFLADTASAQSVRVYQLSGLVINRSSQEPVPYARIRINSSRRGAVANREGFYSVPVVQGDTIYFSSLGYKTTKFVFSDYLREYKGDPNSAYIYAINYLNEDSITLQDIVIFPYNTAAELRTAIIETDVPEAIASINARDNLDPNTLDELMKTMKVDEGERVLVARQLYYSQHQQRNVAPTMPLFDPVAVYQLLRYINQKTKERKEKNLNYWNE